MINEPCLHSGILFILTAPSGGGKSVVRKAIVDTEYNTFYSISVTTRPPRCNEVNAEDYYFVSNEEFDRLIKEDMFYEWAQVYNNRYGTRKDIIAKELRQGKDIILDLDVQGALAVKEKNPNSVIIFILPPSMQVLEERLRFRNTDDEKTIQLRLSNAHKEIESASKFDYFVVNIDLAETIEIVKSIIDAERHRVAGKKFCVNDSGNIKIE